MKRSDPAHRSSIMMQGAVLGMAANVLLAAGKMTLGILTKTGSITADGVNNLSDTLSILIAWITGRMARKPGDQAHPYGHGRMEYVGTLVVGIFILLMGWELLTAGVSDIISPKPLQFHPAMLVVLPMSILVKLGLAIHFTRVGRQSQLPSLMAAGADCRSDVFATSAVLAGMLIGKMTGWQLDGFLSVGVSCLVLRSGWMVCRDMVDALLGGGDNRALAADITARIKACPGILGVHDLMIHDYGPGRIIASLHAEVSADEKLLDIHHVIDQAEREIGDALQLELMIHLDPVVQNDPETEKIVRQLEDYLRTAGEGITLHDFRRVPGRDETNRYETKLIFDLEVPPEFSGEAALTEGVRAFVREQIDPSARCILRVDRRMYGGSA